MRLIFYNNFNNGDIHLVREFVKDIIKKTNFEEYHFLHNKNKKTLLDIEGLVQGDLNDFCFLTSPYHTINNDVYINTHLNVYEIFVDKVTDVTLSVFYDYFGIIYDRLKIRLEPIKFYVPSINYGAYKIDGINEYLKNNKNSKVLVCNNAFFSSQSGSVDFKTLIEKLSDEFPEVHFILTSPDDHIEKPNVFYTKDIIQETWDLNEISYLSTFCSIIIGRSSGPATFCYVKDNLYDVDKTFITMCQLFSNVTWHDKVLCNKVWINNYSIDHIYPIISNELKKINNYKNLFQISVDSNRIIITPLENLSFDIRIEFYHEREKYFIYGPHRYTVGIFHWVTPHAYYTKGMPIRCKFYNSDKDEYLFQKIV